MIGLCSKNQTEISRMYRRKRKQKPGRVAVSAAAHKLARVVWAVLAKERDFRPSCTAA